MSVYRKSYIIAYPLSGSYGQIAVSTGMRQFHYKEIETLSKSSYWNHVGNDRFQCGLPFKTNEEWIEFLGRHIA